MRGDLIRALGTDAFLVKCGEEPSDELTTRMLAICSVLKDHRDVVDAAPGYTTLLVEAAPGAAGRVRIEIERLMDPYIAPDVEIREHRVEARYDGPDLPWLCENTGLSDRAVIAAHTAFAFQVKALGSPGFIYLGPVDEAISAPRLPTPRNHVPAGSIGIGGRQTGIYGAPRPGGWRIIGTALTVPPMKPGDRVRFAEA